MTSANTRALILLVAGFTIWSAGFVLVYALQALGCAYGWPQHRLIVLVAGIASLVPIVVLSIRSPYDTGEPATSLSLAALWANRAALASGVLVLVLPSTFVSLCT